MYADFLDKYIDHGSFNYHKHEKVNIIVSQTQSSFYESRLSVIKNCSKKVIVEQLQKLKSK